MMKTAAVIFGDFQPVKEKNLRAISAAAAFSSTPEEPLEIWSCCPWKGESLSLPRCVLTQLGETEVLPDGRQCADVLEKLVSERSISAVFFPGGMLFNEVAARLAARTGGSVLTDVTMVRNLSGDEITVEREIYGYNLNGCFTARKWPVFVTLSDAFAAKELEPGPVEEVQIRPLPPLAGISRSASQLKKQDTGLAQAKVMLVCGRGVSKEGVALMEEICSRTGCALGATKAAIMDGKMPESAMIGISGVRAKPEVTVVFGASGAAAFMKGVSESKLLAAVNKDPDALIFRYCDAGIQDDSQCVLENLHRMIMEK